MSTENENAQVVVGEHLPFLPNWLPLSSQDIGRVNGNLEALLGVARRLYGHRFPEWLSDADNVYGDKLSRCRKSGVAAMPAAVCRAGRNRLAAA